MLTDNYNQMTRRPKPYLVIGTASLEGEDTQCKGRVRFFNDDTLCTIVTVLFLILRAMLTGASFVQVIIFEIEQPSADEEDVFALRHLYSKAMKVHWKRLLHIS